MLRRFLRVLTRSATRIPLETSAFPPKYLLRFRMSSESEKRGAEATNPEETDSKKPKLSDEAPIDNIVAKALESSNRVRKPKKVVLLLSYLGKEYYGMQRNHNVSTVEEELLKALLQAGAIVQSEFDHPKTMKFQRAARTDKGVSAVRQIVSLKIPQADISSDLLEKVNPLLPPQIRLVAVKRVTQSFDAKIACDARTYAYMLPTFAFAPTIEESNENFCISEDRIDEVNSFLKKYIGTKNFYNFTSGRLPGDPSCKRFIMSCECGPPFESCGLELCVVRIKGQSFMLHQIRKMVGLAIAHIRGLAEASVLDKAWLNERIDIPKAPGLGLMLEEIHYDWYNSKYGADGIHETLQWNDCKEVIETFKQEKICANIALTEREEKSMLQWLETLPHHSYDASRDAGPPSLLPPLTPVANGSDPLDVPSSEQTPCIKAEGTDPLAAPSSEQPPCIKTEGSDPPAAPSSEQPLCIKAEV